MKFLNTINLKFNFSKLFQLLIIFILAIFLNSCGLYKKTDRKTNPINDAEKRKKNIEEGRGFRLSKGIKNRKGGDFQFASSNAMWRASLKVLDFIPLVNADYGGGIIITDWYNDDDSNNDIKITIMFSSNEVRADGITIIIHEKECIKNICKTNILNSDLNNEIKVAILRKAAQLQNIDFKKNKDSNPEYPIKKNN